MSSRIPPLVRLCGLRPVESETVVAFRTHCVYLVHFSAEAITWPNAQHRTVQEAMGASVLCGPTKRSA